jgi:hypothetical protein
MRDRNAFNGLVANAERLLAVQHARFEATISFLRQQGHAPPEPFRLSSMPPPLLEDLYRRLREDDFGLRLVLQSTTVKATDATAKATRAAADVLLNPDAAVALMLRSGKLQLRFAWYEIMWLALPFTDLALAAAEKHHCGGPSPTFLNFVAEVKAWDLRSPDNGAPSLSACFSRLRWFLGEMASLEIKYPVLEILTPLVERIGAIGYGKTSEFDKFLLWMLQRTKPYVDAESAPPSVLDEILEHMEELVTTEGTLDSRLRRGAASSRAVHSVIEVERAAHSDPWFDYESYVTFAAPPPELASVFGVTSPSGSSDAHSSYGQCTQCKDPGFRGSDWCLKCDRARHLLVICNFCGGSTRWSWFCLFGCQNQLRNPSCSGSKGHEVVVGPYHTIPTPHEVEMIRAQHIRTALIRLRQAQTPRPKPIPLPVSAFNANVED